MKTSKFGRAPRSMLGKVLTLTVTGLLLASCASGVGDAEGNSSTDGIDAEEQSEDVQATTISVASFLIDGTPNADMVNWFLDTVEEESDGSIEFERFPNESLCPGAEIVECVTDGRADMGITVPSYTPDRFPLQDLSALPFMTDDNGAMMRAFYTLGQESDSFRAETENQGLRSLGYWPAGALLLGAKEQINDMTDLDGVRIRGVGEGLLSALDAANANPIALTAGEMYEAVERGTISAIANNMDAPIDYKLMEVLPYWVDTGYGHYITIGMWIAQSKYDSLTDEQRDVIDSVTVRLNEGEGIRKFAETAAQQCQTLYDSDSVKDLIRWDDDAIEQWRTATGTHAQEEWIKNAEAAGVSNAAEVLQRYQELLDEYSTDGEEAVAPLIECADTFKDR